MNGGVHTLMMKRRPSQQTASCFIATANNIVYIYPCQRQANERK